MVFEVSIGKLLLTLRNNWPIVYIWLWRNTFQNFLRVVNLVCACFLAMVSIVNYVDLIPHHNGSLLVLMRCMLIHRVTDWMGVSLGCSSVYWMFTHFLIVLVYIRNSINSSHSHSRWLSAWRFYLLRLIFTSVNFSCLYFKHVWLWLGQTIAALEMRSLLMINCLVLLMHASTNLTFAIAHAAVLHTTHILNIFHHELIHRLTVVLLSLFHWEIFAWVILIGAIVLIS